MSKRVVKSPRNDAVHGFADLSRIEAGVDRGHGRGQDLCAHPPQREAVGLDSHILAVGAVHEDGVAGIGPARHG